MDYSLNVCTSLSFDDDDIFDYLDYVTLPYEPTDEEGLDDEAEEFAMNFIKNVLLKGNPIILKIDEEATKDSSMFKDLEAHMEIYIFLKRHARYFYNKIKKNLKRYDLDKDEEL